MACPQPDGTLKDALEEFLRGREADAVIQEYVADCQKAINLTEAADKIPACDGNHPRTDHVGIRPGFVLGWDRRWRKRLSEYLFLGKEPGYDRPDGNEKYGPVL
jgi:hypothetical protein